VSATRRPPLLMRFIAGEQVLQAKTASFERL
jgi:hypothetical protein